MFSIKTLKLQDNGYLVSELDEKFWIDLSIFDLENVTYILVKSGYIVRAEDDNLREIEKFLSVVDDDEIKLYKLLTE